ncbi:MAG: DUF3786 domain-containing protein [Eubacteriales bacterium]|nr:DUF3786 domain-containing protein [Eubacteriales bacterium]
MIKKFKLEHDKEYLYIQFAGRRYRIHRSSGSVSWSEDFFQSEEKANYNEAMTIYDVLCCSKADCRLAGEWVNVGSLSAVRGGSLVKNNHFFGDAGKYFEGKARLLACACEKLHGRKTEKGDVAYELDMFSFLPVILRFWEADEEFPASLQILVDKNILDYMHYETVMFAVSHILERLKSECDGAG